MRSCTQTWHMNYMEILFLFRLLMNWVNMIPTSMFHCCKVVNTTKDNTKRLCLDQAFPQCDWRPIKTGGIYKILLGCCGLVLIILQPLKHFLMKILLAEILAAVCLYNLLLNFCICNWIIRKKRDILAQTFVIWYL